MTDNKIENKLLHYRTKAAFEADRKNIKPTSIAFVDEDLIIYTHGKYYSVGIDQKLAEVYQNVNEIIAEFESNINSAVDSLRAEALENHQAAIQQARAGIEEAKSKIQQIQDSLANYAPTTEIQQLQGRINAITDWFAEQDDRFTRIEQSINAVDAKIITSAQYTQLAQQLINEYSHTVDLKLAQVREEISSTNVESLTQSVVGRLMDAENGILKDYATVSWVDSQLSNLDTSNIVQAVFNAMDPSWQVLVQRVSTNTATGETLEQEVSRLWVEANKISGITSSLDEHTSRIAALELNSGSSGAAVTLAAIMDVLDSDTQRRIASEIFLTANEAGSGITLAADKIDLQGDTSVLGTFVANMIQSSYIIADALTVGSGANLIKADTNGLYHINTQNNRSSFKINADGSGQLGYTVTEVDGENVYTPAISWTSTGILSINSAVIGGGGGEGGGTTYIENPYDDTALDSRLDAIEAWKTTTQQWVAQQNLTNGQRAYLTAGGIIFDNVLGNGQIVSMTSANIIGTASPRDRIPVSRSIPAGVAHTRISDGAHGYYLKNDGTGELAFGNITWDAQGNLTANNLTLNANTTGVSGSSIVFEITSWFQQFITYRIIKNGLVVKTGEEDGITLGDLVSSHVMRADKFVTNSNGDTMYNEAADAIAAGIDPHYRMQSYTAEVVSNSSLTEWVRVNLKNSMFLDPNDSTVSLISPGDTVFVKLPENRYYYNTRPLYGDEYNIADIGGVYNANGVTISTSEQLRDFVYDYFMGVHANDTVISDLIDLAVEQDRLNFIADGIANNTWYKTYPGKTVVDVVTDPTTQVSKGEYYAYMWEHYSTSPTFEVDTPEQQSSESNYKKFKTGYPVGIRATNLLVSESTSITWPSIAH